MDFKKHISTLLTFLILASNMGLALNVHYCHGRVASVSFAYKLEESCKGHHEEETKTKACCAADTGHKHCCKNDLVKLQDDSNNDNILVKSLQLDLSAFCAVEGWEPMQFFAEAPLIVQQ
ncbi:MAG TPA: hypothetical protein VEA37_01275, partial [Flavobacterium sp.]|nr:hypothetical protein [Flavobacterium sp.]